MTFTVYVSQLQNVAWTGHFVMLIDVRTHLIVRISCFGSFNPLSIFAVCVYCLFFSLFV